MNAPLPGWYVDPTGTAGLRWWDGGRWTRLTRQLGAAVAPARWLPRVRAYLLDAMWLWAISLLALSPFHRAFTDELVGVLTSTLLTQGGRLPTPQLLWEYGLPLLWLRTAIPGVLLRICWDMFWLVRRGATWGHGMEGLQVVPEDPAEVATRTGPGLPWRRVLVRSLVLRVLAPTCLGWLVVVLWPLVDERGRSLADIAARLRVVERVGPIGSPAAR